MLNKSVGGKVFVQFVITCYDICVQWLGHNIHLRLASLFAFYKLATNNVLEEHYDLLGLNVWNVDRICIKIN